ncbi:MAG: hypothetical protein ACXIUZ_06100 [Lysobacteraceae bacterium]
MSIPDVSSVQPAAGLALGQATPGSASAMDTARFASAMGTAQGPVSAQMHTAVAGSSLVQATAAPTAASAVAGSDGARTLLAALEKLNARTDSIREATAKFSADGVEMTPSDMLQVTVRAHELLFHCELTSNVANRTSDGIQQLFRQQS